MRKVLGVLVLVVSVAAGLAWWSTSASIPEIELNMKNSDAAPEREPMPSSAPARPKSRPAPARKEPVTAPARPAAVVPRAPVAPPPALAPKPVPGGQTGGAANYTALLIGINKAPGSTPLEGSIKDTDNMRDLLLRSGFKRENIVKLNEGAATRGAILAALDAFAKRTSGKGLAVFLLSTHSGSSGGDLTFATGGGGRVSRHELASRLARVPGKLWSMLPTCYSEGYALPGVIGKNRIAVFSSKQDDRTWQVGGAGSWLVLYMIDYGLLRGEAGHVTTVEDAFKWAKAKLLDVHSERAPILSDGISGEQSFRVP